MVSLHTGIQRLDDVEIFPDRSQSQRFNQPGVVDFDWAVPLLIGYSETWKRGMRLGIDGIRLSLR